MIKVIRHRKLEGDESSISIEWLNIPLNEIGSFVNKKRHNFHSNYQFDKLMAVADDGCIYQLSYFSNETKPISFDEFYKSLRRQPLRFSLNFYL
jgi:hypothetical protein